jgi:IstB-like ATP binding protein
MIFTTNKSLKAWDRVLHDEDLAQAIIDRALERGRLLRLDGPSVRTLHVNLDDAMKEDSDRTRTWSEFPEKAGQNFRNPHLTRCGCTRIYPRISSLFTNTRIFTAARGSQTLDCFTTALQDPREPKRAHPRPVRKREIRAICAHPRLARCGDPRISAPIRDS